MHSCYKSLPVLQDISFKLSYLTPYEIIENTTTTTYYFKAEYGLMKDAGLK